MTTRLKTALWTTESKFAYLLLFPAFAVLIVFMFYPIAYVFLMAFYKTNKLGQIVEFIGLGNFYTLFKNSTFWEVTVRSIVWTVVAVGLKTSIGLLIAILLNIEFTGRRIYRTLVIIPWASSVPISAMLWQWTFNSEFGLLNHTLKATGLTQHPPFWLAYPTSAFFANLYVDIWIGVPYIAKVLLAGLQAVPQDIYESAQEDGASAWTCFWRLTLPLLKRVVLIATLLSSLWTFNDFNVIYILTKGGPINKTDILITFIYQYSFQYLKFGPAAAMAVITFTILLLVSLVYAVYYFRSEEL